MDLRPEKKGSGRGPFERLGLSKEVCDAAKSMGFDLPSPIQRKAIPIILSEAGDVLANARTGSGKTAAFLFPALHRLASHSSVVGVRCVIVLPTRELALQTGLVLRKMIKGCGKGSDAATLRVCYLIGGMSMAKQFEHLSNNPDILVCTPGRLVHQMVETDFRLTRVNTIIFDEGDMLFELGFEDDITKILKAVSSCVKKQIIITSATLPTQLVQFTRAKLQNPQFVQLDAEQSLPDTLALELYFIRSTDKTSALLFWLENVMPEESQCIIFCGTSHHVAYLAEVLKYHSRNSSTSQLQYRASGCRFKEGPFSCTQLAGQLSQGMRDEAMKDFVKKNTRILLATDVAARGVDIDKLDYVVHYTFPASPKLFIHRSGRTARKGQKGSCVSFITREEFPYLVDLLLFIGRKIKLPSTNDQQSEEIGEELEKFSFDFGIGDDLDKVVASRKSNSQEVDIGGLPDLNDYREIISLANAKDSSITKLAQTMKNGEKAYLRHRQPASKQSLKRTAKILQALGGSGALADSIHPALRSIEKSEQMAREILANRREIPSLFSSLKPEIKVEVESLIAKSPTDFLSVDDIRSFRPTKSANKGVGISAKALGDVEARRAGIKAITQALTDLTAETKEKKERLDKQSDMEEELSSIPASEDVNRKPRLSTAARKHRRLTEGVQNSSGSKRFSQLQELEEFTLAKETRDEVSMAKEIGLTLESSRRIERNTFGLLGEEPANLKPKRTMRWNSAKKKYEAVDVDRASGKRLVRNDAGKVVESVNKGLYKKWSSSTQRRIQNVGELEDSQMGSDFLVQRKQRRAERFNTNASEGETTDSPKAPLSSLTGNLALLEKIDRKLPLTAKEARTHKRLLKLQANPIVTGTAQNSKAEPIPKKRLDKRSGEKKGAGKQGGSPTATRKTPSKKPPPMKRRQSKFRPTTKRPSTKRSR